MSVERQRVSRTNIPEDKFRNVDEALLGIQATPPQSTGISCFYCCCFFWEGKAEKSLAITGHSNWGHLAGNTRHSVSEDNTESKEYKTRQLGEMLIKKKESMKIWPRVGHSAYCYVFADSVAQNCQGLIEMELILRWVETCALGLPADQVKRWWRWCLSSCICYCLASSTL